MAQVINTNVASINSQRQLFKSQNMMETAMERLSSGLRINSAKDDAAGLSIADRMTAQIKGLNQAVRNANDGISIAQVAEGALGEITNALQRMREIAVQSANDTNSATDRASLQKEVAQLQQEITRIATQTQFNGKSLVDGSFTSQQFQVGAYANQTISFTMGDARSTAIGANKLNINGTLNNATALAGAHATTDNPVLATEDLTISGPLGTTSPAIDVAADSSAKTIAAQINAVSAQTGVQATAVTKATLSGLTATGTYTFNLYGSNTTATAFSVNLTATSDLTALSDAINAKAASTGITATVSGGTVTLTSLTGDDIAIENWAGAGNISFQGLNADTGATAGAAVALTGATTTTDSSQVGGTLTFTSSSAFTVTSAAAGGLFTAATAQASALSNVATLSVGTQSGANSALTIVDGALAFIDDLRATLGAIQNRFSSAIASLQATSQNVSAARSRIQDADFAQETSSLATAQILQQAGTAMLAQANAAPQNVLTLLRG